SSGVSVCCSVLFCGGTLWRDSVALLEARQGDVEAADALSGAVPLDEDRTLVAAVGDNTLAVALADAQIDRTLHPQEATRRHRERPREETLEHAGAQPGDIEHLIQRPHHVVL